METKTMCFVSAEKKTQSETPFGVMFALLQQGELSDFESRLDTTANLEANKTPVFIKNTGKRQRNSGLVCLFVKKK